MSSLYSGCCGIHTPPTYPDGRVLLPEGASPLYPDCSGLLAFPDTQVGWVLLLEGRVPSTLDAAIKDHPLTPRLVGLHPREANPFDPGGIGIGAPLYTQVGGVSRLEA